MTLVALLLAAVATPPAPEPPKRTTPIPPYSVDCHVVGRDGGVRQMQMSLTIAASGRRAHVNKDTGDWEELEISNAPITNTSILAQNDRWDTTEFVSATYEGLPVSIWIKTEAEMEMGAHIQIKPHDFLELPHFVGMCSVVVEGQDTQS